MIEIKLKMSDFHYYNDFGLWIHKDFTPATIDEAYRAGDFFGEYYIVAKRWADKGKDYWGCLNNKGEEVKVKWIK
jgi:hypothetical protein